MRTTFLIDGFNLYHSVVDASNDLKGATTKWLDIDSLCHSFLYIIDPKAYVEEIYYFSALAEHLRARDPGKIQRHRAYLNCLKSTGILVELGRFKKTTVWCDHCERYIRRHEEKETDVAISARLLEIFIKDECDAAVLVTGDTDLAPAVRTAQKLFPHKFICFAFPYKRKNKELEKLAYKSFKIRRERYLQHQFPDPVVLPDGQRISKPAVW